MMDEEHKVAGELASEAGVELMDLRARSVGGKALGQEGDRLSHQLLTARLGAAFPDDRIRSEEGDRGEALGPSAGRIWIVDPLDGTREYGEGREDWAVHVALAVDGVPAVGAVALPALDVVLRTADPPPLAEAAAPPRIVVSRSRPPAFVTQVAERLGAIVIPMGSAGAKIAAVIRGEAEVYLHAGGQYEWDSAAPVAVAIASGLHATRLDGSPLRYSQPDPWLPDLVVCHPVVADQVSDALIEAGVSGP
ncbi:MAG: 3'(2'),5'-bisphosphate nucleotidase CysQ [Acidimicrobiales bacterium]